VRQPSICESDCGLLGVQAGLPVLLKDENVKKPLAKRLDMLYLLYRLK
jgi:hypothetical protein